MTNLYVRKMYVAASFDSVQLVRDLRDRLTDVVEVTSSWCEERPLLPNDYREQPQEARFRANEDLLDIERSSIVAILTDVPSTTGGFHVELGLALADKTKRVIVVGARLNVFHYMNRVEQVMDIDALVDNLTYEYEEGLA